MRGAPGGGWGLSPSALFLLLHSSPPGGGRRARGEHGGVRGRPPRVLRAPHARGPRAGRCGPRGAGGAPGRRGGGVRSLRGRLGRARALSGERRLRRAGDGGGDPVQPTGGVERDGVGQRCGAPTARPYLRPPSQPGYCMQPGWPPPHPAAPPRPRLLLLGHAPPAGLRPPQVGGGGSARPTHVNWTKKAGEGGEGMGGRERERPPAPMTSSALDAKGRGSPGDHVTSLGPGVWMVCFVPALAREILGAT